MMKRLFVISLALAACLSSLGQNLSQRVVYSEMARLPKASYIDGLEGKLKWNYTPGLEMKSFLDVYQKYGDEKILAYVDEWYDDIIDSTGAIYKYKKSNFSTDHICAGKTLFLLYDLTGKEKYRKTMDILRDQLKDQPRTTEGGFYHKQVYPHQMWLDGLYMAQPFYAEYVSRYEPQENRAKCYEDIMNNFLVVAKHTYDPKTKLYRHAWDESKGMFWADKATGQSQHAWGRALGWYCMAIVDVLPFIPDGTPGKKDVVKILRGIYKVLPKYADPQSGMWYQVLDQPGREGNYTEATCSAMFTYALLKGIRLGYLPKRYEKNARKTYENLLKEFVKVGDDGLVNLVRCCAVAGLGGSNNRSGDYNYYINEKIVDNDPKGIGPLIWSALEMEGRKK